MHSDTPVLSVQEDGATLLNDISIFIARFVVVTPAQADVCAIWVLHTHALDAAELTPYIQIHSPMLRSGKTLLSRVLSLLVSKPWYTGHVTGAALTRNTAQPQPT